MQKKIESKTSSARRDAPEIPPGALVLQTSWMVDANGRYVGLISDPQFIQCTYKAELQGDCPVVTDRFISMASEVLTASDRNAISVEQPANHEHRLSHPHSFVSKAGSANNKGKVDANNSGPSKYVAAPEHVHNFELGYGGIDISLENEPQVFEPLHYEVSAFWKKPTEEQYAYTPAGMLVFSDETAPEHGEWSEDWLLVSKHGLEKDVRDMDGFYWPRPWNDEALKIVGCVPSKRRKGAEYHTHLAEAHSHAFDSCESSRGTSEVDDSSGGFDAALKSHKHDSGLVHSAEATMLGVAENNRRNKKLKVWIARRPDAKIFKDMLIPYIPTSRDMYEKLRDDGVWAFSAEDSETDSDPLFFTSNHLKVGRVEGSNMHDHTFQHGHSIELAASGVSGGTYDQDDEVNVADKNHGHDSNYYHDSNILTGASINPLSYRRIMFIRKRYT